MTWLILILVLVAMAAVVAILALGLRGRWASLPFLALWGLAVLPALFMSLVGLCENAAGTCTEPARVDLYKGALPALIILLIAGIALFVRHPVARGIVFPVLTAIGAVLVALRLNDDDQRFMVFLIVAFLVVAIAREVLARTRLRAGARTSAG